MLIALGAAAFGATVLGGLFALRFRDHLHLVLGFSAGAVLGVAFFDILPEAIELGGERFDVATILGVSALAFLVYLFIDRFVVLHAHTDEEGHGAHAPLPSRGVLGASSLSLHSMLDGAGIGFAFQVSPEVGIIVAAAVLAHGFSDGINTVNLLIKNGGTRLSAMRWLLVDASAPLVGIIATFFITVSSTTLGLILASFAGFFLYIGASDLLPESHHRHPTIWTSVMTALGVALVYLIIAIARG